MWGFVLVTAGVLLSPPPVWAADDKHIVVVGVANLQWGDIDESATPHLWQLVDASGVGSLNVRTIGALTCPDDAWLTIGAGVRSRADDDANDSCPSGSRMGMHTVRTSDTSWSLPGQHMRDKANDAMSYGSSLGRLGDVADCVAAIGPGASVAAADSTGRIDRYRTQVPESAAHYDRFTRDCGVVMIDPDTAVEGTAGEAQRVADAARLDAAIGHIMSVVDAEATVIVAGISDSLAPTNLHPTLIRSPDYQGKWLTSASTGRAGYIQLADLGATVAHHASSFHHGMSGRAVYADNARDFGTAATVARAVDTNDKALVVAQSSHAYYLLVTLVGVGIAVAAVVMVRARSRRWRWRIRRGVRVCAPVAASIPLASFVVNAVPWWRTDADTVVLWALIAACAVACGAAAVYGPWRSHPYGPVLAVAGATVIVIGVDCVTGAHLQFNSLTGYSPLTGARYSGMGNYGFGVFAAGGLIAAILAAAHRARPAGVIAPAAIVMILVVGYPSWGNDAGGVLALTPAFLLAGIHAVGDRIGVKTVTYSLAAAVGVVATLMMVDYARPASQQTHLGRFAAQIFAGDAWDTLWRKANAALATVTSTPLTLTVVATAVAVVLLWRTAALEQVRRHRRVCVSAALGVGVVAVLGFAFNDSGIAVSAFVLSVATPLAAYVIADEIDRGRWRATQSEELVQ